MYNTVKKYYDMGKYTLEQMHVFVKAKWITVAEYYTITSDKGYLKTLVVDGAITEVEYKEITGEDYII